MAVPALVYAGMAAYQLYSANQQAKAIARNAQLTNKINAANARFLEIDAYEAEKFGYTQVARYDNMVSDVIGQQRSGYASQNVDVNFGTAGQLQAESKLAGYLNTLDMQSEARKKALGLKNEASNVRLGMFMTNAQSKLDQQAARTAGLTGAINTGISFYDRQRPPGVDPDAGVRKEKARIESSSDFYNSTEAFKVGYGSIY
jgi:hypothetical protein